MKQITEIEFEQMFAAIAEECNIAGLCREMCYDVELQEMMCKLRDKLFNSKQA